MQNDGTLDTNDNDTWVSLAAATARALKLYEKQDIERCSEQGANSAHEQADQQRSDHAFDSVRRIRAFERRYRNRRGVVR